MSNRIKSAVAVLTLTLATGAQAAQPPAFKAMVAKVSALHSYQTTIAISTALSPVGGGQGETISVTEKAAYQSPNKSAVITSGIMGNFIVLSDGVHLYSYTDLSKQYTVSPAPKDFATSLLAGIGAAKLSAAGVSSVGGVRVNVVKGTLATPRGTADVTIDVGAADSLPRVVTVVIPQLMSPHGAYRVTTTEVFSNQVVNARIAPATFRFVPPAGSSQSSSPSGGGIGQMLGIPGMP